MASLPHALHAHLSSCTQRGKNCCPHAIHKCIAYMANKSTCTTCNTQMHSLHAKTITSWAKHDTNTWQAYRMHFMHICPHVLYCCPNKIKLLSNSAGCTTVLRAPRRSCRSTFSSSVQGIRTCLLVLLARNPAQSSTSCSSSPRDARLCYEHRRAEHAARVPLCMPDS